MRTGQIVQASKNTGFTPESRGVAHLTSVFQQMVWLLVCDWAPQGRAEAGGQLRDPCCFQWGDEVGLEQRSCAKSAKSSCAKSRLRCLGEEPGGRRALLWGAG